MAAASTGKPSTENPAYAIDDSTLSAAANDAPTSTICTATKGSEGFEKGLAAGPPSSTSARVEKSQQHGNDANLRTAIAERLQGTFDRMCVADTRLEKWLEAELTACNKHKAQALNPALRSGLLQVPMEVNTRCNVPLSCWFQAARLFDLVAEVAVPAHV
eukprot:CAMPEP_0115368226 /NCGR_PEP_ID=MMETSP0270-20121206/105711_1 /TAXON_ID=71861 /ORGANISM="Scrippsiella trochoidea, Strain CCMP3099" /LENGTH=159 /DNA_ID=CAMNT_0002791021 /DNA_START=27 /DNA_END=503 /DNA_ORIENTATION=+